MRSICCYGGSPKYAQIQAFERGLECVIATPGRLNDLIEMKKADLSNVKFVVVSQIVLALHSFMDTCAHKPAHLFTHSSMKLIECLIWVLSPRFDPS
jgi:hypothetical protein